MPGQELQKLKLEVAGDLREALGSMSYKRGTVNTIFKKQRTFSIEIFPQFKSDIILLAFRFSFNSHVTMLLSLTCWTRSFGLRLETGALLETRLRRRERESWSQNMEPSSPPGSQHSPLCSLPLLSPAL